MIHKTVTLYAEEIHILRKLAKLRLTGTPKSPAGNFISSASPQLANYATEALPHLVDTRFVSLSPDGKGVKITNKGILYLLDLLGTAATSARVRKSLEAANNHE